MKREETWKRSSSWEDRNPRGKWVTVCKVTVCQITRRCAPRRHPRAAVTEGAGSATAVPCSRRCRSLGLDIYRQTGSGKKCLKEEIVLVRAERREVLRSVAKSVESNFGQGEPNFKSRVTIPSFPEGVDWIYPRKRMCFNIRCHRQTMCLSKAQIVSIILSTLLNDVLCRHLHWFLVFFLLRQDLIRKDVPFSRLEINLSLGNLEEEFV